MFPQFNDNSGVLERPFSNEPRSCTVHTQVSTTTNKQTKTIILFLHNRQVMKECVCVFGGGGGGGGGIVGWRGGDCVFSVCSSVSSITQNTKWAWGWGLMVVVEEGVCGGGV